MGFFGMETVKFEDTVNVITKYLKNKMLLAS